MPGGSKVTTASEYVAVRLPDAGSERREASPAELRKVVLGASLGTVFEWYDFFIYAVLASVLSRQFFAGVDETSAFIVTLLSFSAGTAIRPLGSVIFGRYGDLLGRKRTFLATITLMGGATFCVGLLPGYASWGAVSAFLLVGLRLLQGFALGGEYGGAAIYVAEHAPARRRGFFTSWIQITTPLGQLLAMLIIFVVQLCVDAKDFNDWAWRIPFLLSIVLLMLSIWIRMAIHESPVFQAMKRKGTLSKAPLTETFLKWKNLRLVLLALFGLAAGQAVVINVGMTYSFFFMTQSLKVDFALMNGLHAIALFITAPFFVIFGSLSDKIGRKAIIMTGLLLAVIGYRPIFQGLTHFANPALETAQINAPVKVIADTRECSFQFNPTGTARFTSSCDLAKSFLSRGGIPYRTIEAPPGSVARIEISGKSATSFDGSQMPKAEFADKLQKTNGVFAALVAEAGYPKSANSQQVNKLMVVALISLLMIFATMVYGPMAALLVEMFPPRVRFSSVSTAYNVGNGWFGGFTSPIAFSLIAWLGDIYAGLWYCIGVTALTAIVGILFLQPQAAAANISAQSRLLNE
jgi:MFS family permease